VSDDQIAYVRIQRYDTPDMQAYAAVRLSELAAILARSDNVETVQECELSLPPDVAATLAARLAAPLRPVRADIGDVTGDTWISGPLVGQRRPNPWLRLTRPAPGYRCQYRSLDGHRCDNVGEGLRPCPAHQPGTRWSELPDDGQGDDEDG
jgi:hypothetical protein